MASHIHTCFITAPAGSNLDFLIASLRRRNVNVVGPENLAIGDQFSTGLLKLLTDADLVIGVLTRERRSEWTLFELGQAWALGKRILLFAPPDATHLPSTLRRFVTVRANLSNREAIEFALDQLLAAPEPTGAVITTKQKRSSAGTSLSTDRYEASSLANLSGVELEKLVANALRESGVDALISAPGPDQGADIAVWSDGLQPYVGNPLLLEIKSKLSTPQMASKAAHQLAKSVAAGGGLWGLLLYGGDSQDIKNLPPNILALNIQILFRRLKKESFEDIVRDLRNRRVHGVGD